MARQISGYPDPRTVVTEPTGEIRINGVRHDAHSISLTQELFSASPAVGDAGMMATTGHAELAPPAVVTDGSTLPWVKDGRVRIGDTAIVDLGLSGVMARSLTGRVDSTDSTMGDAGTTISLVDRVDLLRRVVTIDPVNQRMPPLERGGPFRRVGMHHNYLTARLLRACGFFTTPPLRGNHAWASVPASGSLWPEIGSNVTAQADWSDDGYPSWAVAPWGVGLRSGVATYRPYPRNQSRLSPGGHPVFLHYVSTPLAARDRVLLDVMFGSDHRIRLHHDDSRAYLRTRDGATAPFTGISAALPSQAGPRGIEISGWVWPDGRVELRVGDTTVTGTASVSSTFQARSVSEVRVDVDTTASAVAGFQVGVGPKIDLHAWEQTAQIEAEASSVISSVPGFQDRLVLDILKEQATAELATMWLDEDGRFRYRSLARTLAQPVTDTILVPPGSELSWGEAWSDVRDGVRVTWQNPLSRHSLNQSILVWKGSGSTLDAGEALSEIVHPDADQDWIQVAPIRTLNVADPPATEPLLRWFNREYGSWVVPTVETPDQDYATPGASANPDSFTATATELDHRSFLVEVTRNEALLGENALVMTAPEWGKSPSRRRGAAMPELRAGATVAWQDQALSVPRQGPQGADGVPGFVALPVHEHDSGRFVQVRAANQRIGDHLAAVTSQPAPRLTDWVVPADDRRQLADVVRVRFSAGTPYYLRTPSGVVERLILDRDTHLRCIISKKSDTITANDDKVERTQTLSLRILRIEE